MSTSDAVAREAAWLTSHGDGLPALLTANGGPFEVIQGYRTRTARARAKSIYLLRPRMSEKRFATQRKLVTYAMALEVEWPIGSTTTAVGLWETEAAALDAAVELVLERIRGFVEDKTHGGRFLTVAESPSPGYIDTVFEDPLRTANENPAMLRAQITYLADEQIVAA